MKKFLRNSLSFILYFWPVWIFLFIFIFLPMYLQYTARASFCLRVYPEVPKIECMMLDTYDKYRILIEKDNKD